MVHAHGTQNGRWSRVTMDHTQAHYADDAIVFSDDEIIVHRHCTSDLVDAIPQDKVRIIVYPDGFSPLHQWRSFFAAIGNSQSGAASLGSH